MLDAYPLLKYSSLMREIGCRTFASLFNHELDQFGSSARELLRTYNVHKVLREVLGRWIECHRHDGRVVENETAKLGVLLPKQHPVVPLFLYPLAELCVNDGEIQHAADCV